MSQSACVLSANQIARIEGLISAKRTGLLTLSFASKSAVFCFEDGAIGYIFYRGKKGLAALSLLCEDLAQQNGLINFHFDPVPVAGNDPFLPLTETVLNRLRGSDQRVTQTDITTAAGTLAPIPGVILNDTLKQLLEQTMENLIGPLARQVCADIFSATKTLRVAVEALAIELPEPAMAQVFRDTVRNKINALDASEFRYGTNEISSVEVDASAKAGIALSDDIRAMIEEILPLFMGPQAPAMCAEVFSQTTTLRAAVDHIVTHMSNPVAADQFKEVVRKRLLSLERRAPAA